jgi:diaminopimelate decarboxylase
MASNYNSRPRPAEVVVDGSRWWIARPRETVEEVYAREHLSP